ncbi:TonB-dependent receptor domain-containing protein, partial [Staphylococcus aureus]|uniref:TonB-dependent receptor domain-containing protein n=1 Tax=Staphylococcus aureus TaxID=1280 RepID=UPI001E5DD8CA
QPMQFRQSATDADNRGVTTIAGVYAQDQMALPARLQVVLGLRVDRFESDVINNRTATDFSSSDNLISPRVGLVYKPVEPLS